MSKPLTSEELDKIKHQAELLGFESSSPFYEKAEYSLELKKPYAPGKNVSIFYDEMNNKAYVSIFWEKAAANVDELGMFIEALAQVQKIAKELEKDD